MASRFMGMGVYMQENIVDKFFTGRRFNIDWTDTNRPVNVSLNFIENAEDKSGVQGGADRVNGDGKKQMLFRFNTVAQWGDDILNNIDNLELQDTIKEEIKALNRKKIFPDLGDGYEVTKIVVTANPAFRGSESVNAGIYGLAFMVDYTELVKAEKIILPSLPSVWKY